MGEPDRAGLMNVELSSDGTRAAVERSVQNNVDIWLVDSARTARFTNDNAIERFPLWSADSTRIAYNSNAGLHVRASSGTKPSALVGSSRLSVTSRYFARRTTKSGAGGAKPAVTAYSELPNSAIVVGTFVAGFEANGSVMVRVTAPEKWSGDSSTTAI